LLPRPPWTHCALDGYENPGDPSRGREESSDGWVSLQTMWWLRKDDHSLVLKTGRNSVIQACPPGRGLLAYRTNHDVWGHKNWRVVESHVRGGAHGVWLRSPLTRLPESLGREARGGVLRGPMSPINRTEPQAGLLKPFQLHAGVHRGSISWFDLRGAATRPQEPHTRVHGGAWF